MITIGKVLHPTDFSDASAHALAYACAIAERFEAELHVLHVLPDPATLAIGPVGDVPLVQFETQIREAAEQAIARIPPAEQWSGPVTRVIREGPAFVEIVRYAREAGIGLIVMGTHGRTGLSHVLLGSVAEKVVRKASCPVLTVRPEGHTFETP